MSSAPAPQPQVQLTTISPLHLHPFPLHLRAQNEAQILWNQHTFPFSHDLTSPPSILCTPPGTPFKYAVHYHLYVHWSNALIDCIDKQETQTGEIDRNLGWVLRRVVWFRERVKVGEVEGVKWVDAGISRPSLNSSLHRCSADGCGSRVNSTTAPESRRNEGKPKRGRPPKDRENGGWSVTSKIVAFEKRDGTNTASFTGTFTAAGTAAATTTTTTPAAIHPPPSTATVGTIPAFGHADGEDVDAEREPDDDIFAMYTNAATYQPPPPPPPQLWPQRAIRANFLAPEAAPTYMYHCRSDNDLHVDLGAGGYDEVPESGLDLVVGRRDEDEDEQD
jgi:hypothetical protein